MTGVAIPCLFRPLMERQSKGMDITEYVKRNNFAVAQYEPKSYRAAQNRLLSTDMRRSRLDGAERDRPIGFLLRPPRCESSHTESSRSCLSRESEVAQVTGGAMAWLAQPADPTGLKTIAAKSMPRTGYYLRSDP